MCNCIIKCSVIAILLQQYIILSHTCSAYTIISTHSYFIQFTPESSYLRLTYGFLFVRAARRYSTTTDDTPSLPHTIAASFVYLILSIRFLPVSQRLFLAPYYFSRDSYNTSERVSEQCMLCVCACVCAATLACLCNWIVGCLCVWCYFYLCMRGSRLSSKSICVCVYHIHNNEPNKSREKKAPESTVCAQLKTYDRNIQYTCASVCRVVASYLSTVISERLGPFWWVCVPPFVVILCVVRFEKFVRESVHDKIHGAIAE